MSLGGITTSNIVKGLAPMLFMKESKFEIIKRSFIICLTFLVVMLLIFISLNYNFSQKTIDDRFLGYVITFSGMWEYIFDRLWGSAIFFPEITTMFIEGKPSLSDTFFQFESLVLDFYRHWWQYLYTATLLLFTIVAIFKGYKNKFVLLIFSTLFVDIFIHVICRFGLGEGFLYGAHWIYSIPLLLGWLYKTTKNEYASKVIHFTYICLFAGLLINNAIHLYLFIDTAIRITPAQ